MSNLEENTRKLLRELPKVDAPVGLEQRLRKRIAAGEGKSLQPLASGRSNAPWLSYSIAASVLVVMLAGYMATRNQAYQPPVSSPSSPSQVAPSTSSPAGSMQLSEAHNPASSPANGQITVKSSATVDKSTGNSHRDDPSDISALKLTGGTAMESTVPRSTELSQAQQGLASPVSQSTSPHLPGFRMPARTAQSSNGFQIDAGSPSEGIAAKLGKATISDSMKNASSLKNTRKVSKGKFDKKPSLHP